MVAETKILTSTSVRRALKKRASFAKADILSGFFKTGKGEYGEGDVFMGVVVPDVRQVVKQCYNLPLNQTITLAKSRVHEERLCALLILVHKYNCGDRSVKKKIFLTYLKLIPHINNWDLVDLTAPNIVGAELLFSKKINLLFRLARSKNLWKRRIAILATFTFIRNGSFKEILHITSMLIGDGHDLIHKAAGWMLREVGKKSRQVLENFLKKYYKIMPRTMLRYAIERLPETRRQAYLNGRV